MLKRTDMKMKNKLLQAIKFYVKGIIHFFNIAMLTFKEDYPHLNYLNSVKETKCVLISVITRILLTDN